VTGTFVLTWNPDNDLGWPEDDYASVIASTALGQRVTRQWSAAARKGGIYPGDRAFMLRQRRDRGIVASGRFTSEVYPAAHWDGSERTTMYAGVEWETVLAPEDRLPVEALKQVIPSEHWDRFQASGVAVHSAAEDLEALWESHVGQVVYLSPEESFPGTFPEGALTRIQVNHYERDRAARRACIERWGHACVVCGIDFEEAYGPFAKGFIHVHHLRELSTVGENYEVNPIADLRPVCPNCHAMLHTSRPALTIAKLRGTLRRQSGGRSKPKGQRARSSRPTLFPDD